MFFEKLLAYPWVAVVALLVGALFAGLIAMAVFRKQAREAALAETKNRNESEHQARVKLAEWEKKLHIGACIREPNGRRTPAQSILQQVLLKKHLVFDLPIPAVEEAQRKGDWTQLSLDARNLDILMIGFLRIESEEVKVQAYPIRGVDVDTRIPFHKLPLNHFSYRAPNAIAAASIRGINDGQNAVALLPDYYLESEDEYAVRRATEAWDVIRTETWFVLELNAYTNSGVLLDTYMAKSDRTKPLPSLEDFLKTFYNKTGYDDSQWSRKAIEQYHELKVMAERLGLVRAVAEAEGSSLSVLQ